MLEPLVDGWEEEASCEIKMQLLTAAVKLFFKRPPEMQVSYAPRPWRQCWWRPVGEQATANFAAPAKFRLLMNKSSSWFPSPYLT